MNANTHFKLIFNFFLTVLISLAASAALTPFISGAHAGELLDKVNAQVECARVKKRIMAALELYRVENKLPENAAVSVRDIVSAKFLKYELVCPKGGRYSFKSGAKLECSKCDAAPEEKEERTAEVKAEKKAGTDATLETKINKYLDMDDLEFLNNPQKSTAAKNEKLPELSATIETEVKTAEVKTAAADVFKTVAGAQDDLRDEDDEEEEPAAREEQITIKETSNIGKGARDFHNEAIEHARRGEVDNAIEKFKKAIELVPDSFTYHYNYGLFLAKIESYDLAYIEFQRAMRLDTQNTKVKTMIEKLKKAISTR
ncbi:MAG TPA: tetratricopeptide repeat protein [Candidatus Wallbacteria bacterium]|nr:tetratricopeptide repeat protein [Candidatus Wallbacteria bacterium]